MPNYVVIYAINTGDNPKKYKTIIDTTKINKIRKEGYSNQYKNIQYEYYRINLNDHNAWTAVLPEDMQPVWNAIGMSL